VNDELFHLCMLCSYAAYAVMMLQCYYAVMLLCCYAVMLLCCYAVMLLCCYAVMLLCCEFGEFERIAAIQLK
jgi:hypothetical protein